MLPDQPDDNSISGVEPEERAPSLREIAEAAYDEGLDDSDDGDDGPSDRGDGRDRRGRFASKEQAQKAGEAEDDEPPSPDPSEEAQDRPDPAPKGPSNQPPEHWSAEDRAAFDRLPSDAKNFFMRRYSEMEADYTRKSQANAQAVQAVNALNPIFQDPDIQRSMQENNINAIQAIGDWARLHKGAISTDPRARVSILYEIAERMGFDPAKVFATSRPPEPQLPEHLKQDPAVRYVADLHGRTTSDLQALRAELHQFRQAETQRLEQDAVKVTRGSIDAYADEKDKDGRPLRPYFDAVLPYIIDAFRANPQRDLHQTYDEACWAHPQVREQMLQAERNRVSQQYSNERARVAARSNVRGLTSPVSKPSQEKKGNGSLRDTLENSADEVGF